MKKTKMRNGLARLTFFLTVKLSVVHGQVYRLVAFLVEYVQRPPGTEWTGGE